MISNSSNENPAPESSTDKNGNGTETTTKTTTTSTTTARAAIKPSKSIFGEFGFSPNFEKLSKKQKISMKFDNVQFEVNGRQILKSISGSIKSGELCALMGASGAGKSSLLNLLAGRIRMSKKKKIAGNVSVNNELVSPVKFRKNIAYVMQQDALFATATAREALEFSARLRLPPSTSKKERDEIVNDLLKSLGLEKVQDTYCGSEIVRGLSGGERRRASIGVELVTNPSILYLDEPTSGLDQISAYMVCKLLSALAKSGCAVLCTIHQPSSEIFALFDKTMVLSQGKLWYQGRVNQNLPRNLEALGFPLPDLTNPADWLMVVSQTNSGEELPTFNEDSPASIEMVKRASQRQELNEPKELSHKHKSFGINEDSIETRVESSNLAVPDEEVGFKKIRGASKLVQMRLLAQREFLNLGRDKASLLGRFGITIFLNLLFGIVFYDSGNLEGEEYLLQSHFGALTNMFISALFGSANATLVSFAIERYIFLREYSTGTYSAIPYFMSKLLVELPLNFVQALVILMLQYWLVNFNGAFFPLLLSLFLLMIVCSSYAFILGAMVSDARTATELSPLIFVPQLLFAGFFVSISAIPEAIRWVQYLCSLKFGLNIAMIIEFGGDQCGGDPVSEERIDDCRELLMRNDVDEDLMWAYILILLGIFALFRTGSLLILVSRAKNFSS